MTSHDDLLRAILEAPDDDTPRLVLADWLQDRDDPRGEFLRCQALRSRWVPDVQKRTELLQRERVLLAEHREAWLGRLPEFCRDCRFTHGMVRITMAARRFAAKRFASLAPDLFRKGWVESVVLQGLSAYADRVAATPALEEIAQLDLGDDGLDDDAVVTLTGSPHLGRLRRLDLSNNSLTAASLDALIASPSLTRLTWLDLRNTRLDRSASRAIIRLLDSPLGQRLTWLDLSGNDLYPPAEVAYADWRRERQKFHPNRLRNALGMEFVLIPAGSFLMGSADEENGRHADEGPRREIEITRPFYLGVYHVTQHQFERLLGRNPSHFTSDQVPEGLEPGRLPVDSIAPDDCQAFCRQLSALPDERSAGRVYRLPTEAEWEHACRAGTDTPFWWGDSASSYQMNCRGEEAYGNAPRGPRRERPTPGGTFEANPFGLFDMHGNMWDWVADYYAADYFARSPRQDPPGPDESNRSVLKGGSWFNGASWCRSASRFGSTNNSGSYCIGFRIALDGPSKPREGP